MIHGAGIGDVLDGTWALVWPTLLPPIPVKIGEFVQRDPMKGALESELMAESHVKQV